MKVQAMKTLKVRRGDTTMEIPEGAVVDLRPENADALLREGKVRPLAEVFEKLFHEHAARMKELPTIDLDQARSKEMTAIVRELDAAWLREDLPAFTIAMRRLEAAYALATEQRYRRDKAEGRYS